MHSLTSPDSPGWRKWSGPNGSCSSRAALVPVADLRGVARSVIDHIDTDGIEPREEALRQQSFLKVWQKDGLLQGRFAADPESGGFLLTALDARTAPRREVRFADEDEAALD